MRAWITRDPLDPGVVLAQVGAAGDGAAVLFLGTVRDHNEGRPVTGLRYEAYEAMAGRVLADLVAEAAARYGTERIAAAHRVGELGVGEASVVIAVSTPHRAQAFDAARYIIEEIKKRLPVWKEERYAEGVPRWLEGEVPQVKEVARE